VEGAAGQEQVAPNNAPSLQKIVFYHPSNAPNPVRSGSAVAWKIFSDFRFDASISDQGYQIKTIKGKTYPLQKLTERKDARLGSDVPVIITPQSGAAQIEIESVTIETTPPLPVGNWPMRADFGFYSQ
jgi:hypothetical protein